MWPVVVLLLLGFVGVVCLFVFNILLPRHFYSHMPSSEDLSPFLESGCCCARKVT